MRDTRIGNEEIVEIYVIGPKDGSKVREGSVVPYLRRVFAGNVGYFICPIDSPSVSIAARDYHELNQTRRVEEGKQFSNFDISELTIHDNRLSPEILEKLREGIEIQQVESFPSNVVFEDGDISRVTEDKPELKRLFD